MIKLVKKEVLQISFIIPITLKKPDAISLAVGDGGNDVSMITAADVGVGVKGLEGN